MAHEAALLQLYQVLALHRLADLELDQRDDELADWLRDAMDHSEQQVTGREQVLLNEVAACLNERRERQERRDQLVDLKLRRPGDD